MERDFINAANWLCTSPGCSTAVRDEARESGTRCDVTSTIGSFKSKRLRASISSIVSGCRGSSETMAQSGRHFVKKCWMPMREAQMAEKPSRSSNSFAVDVPNSLVPMIRMFFRCPIGLSRLPNRPRHKQRACHCIRDDAPTATSAPTPCPYRHSMCLQDSSRRLVARTPCGIGRVSRLERSLS
jgi:hypothetical protein